MQTEVIEDLSLPDLPTGYQLIRRLDGDHAGCVTVLPCSTAPWQLNTPDVRLGLVLHAWNEYADIRNEQRRTSDLIREIIAQTENTPPPNTLIVESPATAARLRALVGASPHEPLHLHFGINGVSRIGK